MAHTPKWYDDRWPYFIRVHKWIPVNPAYVIQLTQANKQRLPSYLLMRNQVQFAISRRRLPVVRQQLDSFKQLDKIGETSHLRIKMSED